MKRGASKRVGKRSLSRTRTSIMLAASGTLVSFAGIVPPIASGETNLWFWVFLATGTLALLAGLLMASSNKFFQVIRRWVEGDMVVLIRSARDEEIEEIYQMAKAEFGDEITSHEQIQAIRQKYKDAVRVAICKDKVGSHVIRGYFMAFPINKTIVDNIERYSLKISEIQAADVASRSRYGYAFYVGGMVAHGWRVKAELLGAIKLESRKTLLTRTSRAYARAATETGLSRMLKHGFQPVHKEADGINCFFKKTFPKP